MISGKSQKIAIGRQKKEDKQIVLKRLQTKDAQTPKLGQALTRKAQKLYEKDIIIKAFLIKQNDDLTKS